MSQSLPLEDSHLMEGMFACPNDPESYAGWNIFVVPYMSDRSKCMGQINCPAGANSSIPEKPKLNSLS
jgi:hypothetical protein